MNLNDCLMLMNLIVGDMSPATGELAKEQFNILARTGNLMHFKKKIGLPEEYQPNAPVTRQVYEVTTKISQDLSPFKVVMGENNTAPLMINANGIATIPTDLYYPSSLIFKYVHDTIVKNRFVDILTDKEYDRRISSAVEYPTKYFPVCNFQDGYIRFTPKDLQYANFTYLRYPVDPEYKVTVIDGQNVYDAVNSVQFEWNRVNIIDIIHLMLETIGVHIGKGIVYQYAEKLKKEGA